MIGFNFEKTKKNLYLQNFLTEIGIKLNKNKDYYGVKVNKIIIKKKSYILHNKIHS